MTTKEQIKSDQKFHIEALMIVLKSDPMVDGHTKNYKATEGYLWELIEKNGSVMKGIVLALERHLGK